MYDELIKRLREEADCPDNFPEDSCLMREAADAIAELSKKRTGTWHRVKATQRSYSFVCNTCGKMYPQLTRCCPFCGVEYIDEEPS